MIDNVKSVDAFFVNTVFHIHLRVKEKKISKEST